MQLDLLEGSFYAGDPDPTYAWLRREAPVYRDDANRLWGISRHADVIAIEKDAELWTSARGFRPGLASDASMIARDDPQHLQQRRVLFRRFTPRRVKDFEKGLRAKVGPLIDAFAARGHADFVAELAIPLPVMMILELMGFDPNDWPRFARWAEISNAAGGGPRYMHAGVMDAVTEFFGEARALLEERRARPRDDAFSWMIAAHADGSCVRSDEEMLLEALLLLNGGSDTTRHVIAGASLALAQHPEQQDLLRREPDRIPVAVEEFVRWVTPLLNMCRVATRDVELHGQRLRAGDQVLLMYSSANRDERVFAEPQRFDVTREPNPHLGFGFGTHFCMGASLARLELRVVFEELLGRLPTWRLAAGVAPRHVPNAFTRGLAALPIEFGARKN
jgi:cytochrome P450 family 142 subfamily A polypeptide 1